MDAPRLVSSPLLPPARGVARGVSRRRALRGVAGGLALAVAGSAGLSLRPGTARAAGSLGLTNPACRVLLPGEAGLHRYGLDFSVAGPPAVFFAAADTPGWSDGVKTSVDGFLFGYSATLTSPSETAATGRAVQVCVHHGFPSNTDADTAWSSLIAALASSGGGGAEQATVQSLDVVELVITEGQSILATVSGGGLDAIVLASRSGDDLVTVAISDSGGKRPTADEALKLADAEGKKLARSRQIERNSVRTAFDAQWTPGFQLGSAAGAPFFAWPTMLESAPVPVAGETADQQAQRQAANREVAHQSHVEGPLWETSPLLDGHSLYFSAQTNFFDAGKQCTAFHGETETRLTASMPEAAITEIAIGRTESRLAYQTGSSYGTLTGLTLHRIVVDADFPTSLTLHVVAVPASADQPAPDMAAVIERVDILIKTMRGGMQDCLLDPHHAPLTVAVDVSL